MARSVLAYEGANLPEALSSLGPLSFFASWNWRFVLISEVKHPSVVLNVVHSLPYLVRSEQRWHFSLVRSHPTL